MLASAPELPLDPEEPLEPLEPLDPELPLEPLDPELPLDPLEPELPLAPLLPDAPASSLLLLHAAARAPPKTAEATQTARAVRAMRAGSTVIMRPLLLTTGIVYAGSAERFREARAKTT